MHWVAPPNAFFVGFCMTIYAEYLLVENILIGYVILYLTARLSALPVKRGRLLLGSLLCGLYSFIILAPIHPLLLLASKLPVSAVIVFAVFREKKPKILLKYCLVFYGVTIILAGMCFFIIYMGKGGGIAGSAGFYIQAGSYGSIIIGVLCGLVGLTWLWERLKTTLLKSGTEAAVAIYVMDTIGEVQAIVDTGNFLRDPVTGKPVLIADRGSLPDAIAKPPEERLRMIPYRSLGNESGMMMGIRADRVSICRGDQTSVQTDAVVALYEGELFKEKAYRAIIHPSMLVKF